MSYLPMEDENIQLIKCSSSGPIYNLVLGYLGCRSLRQNATAAMDHSFPSSSSQPYYTVEQNVESDMVAPESGTRKRFRS